MNHLNVESDLRLTSIEKGRTVKISHLQGGENFKEKLLSMGIIPGQTVLVMNSGKRGPVIIKVNDTRVVLGHNMAERITVRQ